MMTKARAARVFDLAIRQLTTDIDSGKWAGYDRDTLVEERKFYQSLLIKLENMA